MLWFASFFVQVEFLLCFVKFYLITLLVIFSENEDKEIERYSDRKRKTRSKRESLKSYLKLISRNFHEELLGNLDL
jgi:hypothetical protein